MYEAPKPEGHQEHHQPHPSCDAKEAWQPAQHANTSAGGGQDEIAGAGRGGGDQREQEKGDGLLCCHGEDASLPNRPRDQSLWLTILAAPAALVLNDCAWMR